MYGGVYVDISSDVLQETLSVDAPNAAVDYSQVRDVVFEVCPFGFLFACRLWFPVLELLQASMEANSEKVHAPRYHNLCHTQ